MPPENDSDGDEDNLSLQEELEGGSVGPVDDESDEDTPDDESEDDDDEPGPDESGEQGEESEESDEPESEEGDETEESTDEEDEPEEPETDDPLAHLRSEVERERALNAKLMDMIQSKSPAAPSNQVDTYDDVPDDLLKLAVFGAPQEAYANFNPAAVARAKQAADRHWSAVLKAVRNPEVAFEQIKGKVDGIVNERVAPLHRDFAMRKADSLAEKFLKPLPGPLQKRAQELFKTLPGSKSTSWDDVERDLAISVKLAKAESLDKDHKSKTQKVKAGQVQRKAAGGGKLKGTKTPTATGTPANGRPRKDDKESWVEYHARLKTYEQSKLGKNKKAR